MTNISDSIFTDVEAYIIYDAIYDWLSGYTPGEHGYIPRYKRYQRKAWYLVYSKFDKIKDLKLKKEVGKNIFYNGTIFRLHSNTSKNKGYVKELPNCCVSWSKDINALKKVTNLCGECILLISSAKMAIDTFGLIEYLLKHNKYFVPKNKHPNELERYYDEGEVLYPISFSQIKEIMLIRHDDLLDWNIKGERIPRTLWSKNRMY